MKQVKLKIMLSFTGILLGVVMLVSASYAWFTVSVTPEIQRLVITVTPSGKEVPFELSIDYAQKNYNQEEATWVTELHLDQLVENYTLRPISTVDGIHWYLPKFSADGNVNGFWQLPNNRMSVWANNPDPQDNYMVYADVYVRTRNTDAAQEMILSNPISKPGAGEQHYANYVLWDPVWTDEGTLKTNDAMASVRIGFLYTPLEEAVNAEGVKTVTEGSSGSFYIYEPNADMRSSDFEEYAAATGYSEMAEQIYVLEQEDVSNKVNQYAGTFADHNRYYATKAPKYISATEYQLVNVAQTLGERLIVQKTSSWNQQALDALNGAKLTSKAIGSIGDFCSVNSGTGALTPVATTSREAMTTVHHETIQKMRIFIWIEGQDIDCWNQIAGGNIYANLEFMGRATGSTQ